MQHEVILGIDTNCNVESPKSPFQKLIQQTNTIDTLAYLNTTPNITTQKRGSKRIDTIDITRHLVKHIESSNILPYEQITYSDHRPIALQLQWKCLGY